MEPDDPHQELSNITFRDCLSVANSGSGWQFYLRKFDNTTNPFSIALDNFTVKSAGTNCFSLWEVPPHVRGTMSITNSRGNHGSGGCVDAVCNLQDCRPADSPRPGTCVVSGGVCPHNLTLSCANTPGGTMKSDDAPEPHGDNCVDHVRGFAGMVVPLTRFLLRALKTSDEATVPRTRRDLGLKIDDDSPRRNLSNVLLIVVDNYRPAMGAYGDKEAVTPRMDALAKDSTLFSRAFCQEAWCSPSEAGKGLGSKRPASQWLAASRSAVRPN